MKKTGVLQRDNERDTQSPERKNLEWSSTRIQTKYVTEEVWTQTRLPSFFVITIVYIYCSKHNQLVSTKSYEQFKAL